MSSSVRIGNGCGFWGDNLDAPAHLAKEGGLDFLTLEYLAELTMSILALQKQRDPQAGFARDFLDVLPRLAPFMAEDNLRVVTNAGGMNPEACARRARDILDQHHLRHLPIGIVTGDDLLPRLDDLLAQGHTLTNLDTGEPLRTVRDRVVSANAYLGSLPIVCALEKQAAVVITGRVADACLTVGPTLFAHSWVPGEWDLLSAATAAGHLLECGAQATGGLWCNWQDCDLTNVGYPIAEIRPDGTFTLSKPAGSGGSVNIETVSEQLLYEVGDPAAYLTPDVTADFTSLALDSAGTDTVRVSGARGRPCPSTLKVSIAYRDGWTAAGTLVISGPKAADKARRAGEMVLARLARCDALPEKHLVECLGAGDSLPGVLPPSDPPEVVLRIAVRDKRKGVVERFSRELAPLVTSGPPGTTGYTTGRPTVREVFAYWPSLIHRDVVQPQVNIL